MATRHVIISDFEKWCHRHSESKKLFGKGRIRFDIAIGGLKVWRNCQHHSGRIVNQGEIAALIQLCLGHPTACADIGELLGPLLGSTSTQGHQNLWYSVVFCHW